MKTLTKDGTPRSYGGDADNYGCRKTLSTYTAATGCTVQMYDSNFRPLETEKTGIEQDICPHCALGAIHGGANGSASRSRSEICREMHLDAIRESGRQGKQQIYQCALGLMFWTCPVFSENKFFGALRGSGCINSSTDKRTLEAKCNGTIPPEDFARRVLAFPSCDNEKVVSLAEMLLLCAESLSDNMNSHETVRIRNEQTAAVLALVEEMKAKYPEGTGFPGYSLEKEHQLLDSLRKGDKGAAEKLLNEVLADLLFGNEDNFPHIKYRALELAVLFSRSGVRSGGTSVENNARFFKQLQDAKTIEDITVVLHGLVETISARISLFQGLPHASAMMKAENFIRENFTRKISLREISKVAGLSAPYFSTVFREEMGENLSRYINRLRVEKACRMLLETNLSLGEISGACCFEDQSWFSKIFKAFTGMSPGKYRNQGGMMRKAI